ncbi:uncharacterized protein, partial [Halyomorpha halys]
MDDRPETEGAICMSDHDETPEQSQQSISEYSDIGCSDDVVQDIIESKGDGILLVLKKDDCPLSEEIITIFQEHIENNIAQIIDVDEISGFIKNFDLALERHTGFYPPLVFNHKKFVGDHVDVVNAYRFNRLDLLLEPPLIPHYHIVIVGTGHGARSIISELEGSNTGLRIALIDINPSSPD